MSDERKIGWQKYEDIIESHVNSPILDTILGKFTDISGEAQEEYYEEPEEEPHHREWLRYRFQLKCWMI